MRREFLEGGKIVNTFGIRGEVKIQPWCDSAEFLRRFDTLYVDGAPRRVVSARVHKGMLIARFEGMEDVNAAMPLKNKVVSFRREDAHLEEGGFFLAELIGARVVDESGTEIGTLTEVVDLPVQNVYVVRGATGEHSIPAVPEFVLRTDVDEGVVQVRLIEGM